MARTIIDLGGGRKLDDFFGYFTDGAHTCWLPQPWDRHCPACARKEARLTSLRAESMWTRPMREARGDQELPKP
jgi:hypothetical protein